MNHLFHLSLQRMGKPSTALEKNKYRYFRKKKNSKPQSSAGRRCSTVLRSSGMSLQPHQYSRMTGNTEFYFISVSSLKQELFGILNINSTFRITVSWDMWGLAGLKADSKPRMKFSQLQDGFCPLPQQPCVTQVLLKALTQTAQQTLASMCTEPALLTLLNAGTLDPSGLALLFLYHSTYQASKYLSVCLHILVLFVGTLQLEQEFRSRRDHCLLFIWETLSKH